MASQRDPQNLKNLTKSAKLEPRTPFESSLGRFHFRNGFQVVSREVRNLKKDGFALVKVDEWSYADVLGIARKLDTKTTKWKLLSLDVLK